MPLTEQNVPELSKERKSLKPGEHKTREKESSLEEKARWPQERDGSLQGVLGGEMGRSLQSAWRSVSAGFLSRSVREWRLG